MQILLTIKREPDGSYIELDDKTYHFKPNEHGQHVCEVEDKAHIKTLLAIDCYEVFEEKASTGSTEQPDLSNLGEGTQAGSGKQPDQGFEIQDEIEDGDDDDDDQSQTDLTNQDQSQLSNDSTATQGEQAKEGTEAAAPAAVTREKLDEALSKLPGEHPDPEYVINGMRNFFGQLFTADDESKVRELVKAPAAQAEGATKAGEESKGDAKETTTERTLTPGQKAAQTRAANRAAAATGAPASTNAKPNPALAKKGDK